MDDEIKTHKKWFILLFIVVLIVFCIFFFRIKKVTIEGNTFYDDKKMAEMFQENIWEKNLLSFWFMDRFSLTPELPFVREYEVTYPAPDEIHIKLYEKTILAGVVYANQYIYFDKDGTVLKSTDKPLEKIPLFETKSFTTFTLYSKIKMENEGLLAQILNLSNLFQHYQLPWDRVRFDSGDEAVLYSGNIRVFLGKKDNYDEQISALASILKTALDQKKSGEIDMRNYKVKGMVILKQSETPSKSKKKKNS